MKLFHNAARLVTAPAIYPVSLAVAKSHMVVQHSLDDDLIEDIIIPAATQEAQKLSGYKFITQTWDFDYCRFPNARGFFEVPIKPAQSIESISYIDTNGETQTFGTLSGSPETPEEYSLQRDKQNSRILLKVNQDWPTDVADVMNAVTIRVVGGFGDAASDVPQLYVAGMLLFIGHLYENKETVIVGGEAVAVEIPLGIRDLLSIPKVG